MFKGQKVILRAIAEADLLRIYEFSQDAELAGLDCAFPRAYSIERTRANYQAWVKDDPAKAFFAIEADGKYIGDIGLMGLDNPYGSAELGIGIGDREYWGKGYGREAVRLLLNYAFHYRGLRRVVLTTHARNPRAIRCYLACGFVEEGRSRKAVWVEGEYVDAVNMAILREEWLALQEPLERQP
jgi:RimJ/RimL family protein N-acetyltransferase